MSVQPTITSYVEIRLNRNGEPRAYVTGTRIRVQDIVSDHERHGLSPEEIAREYPQLSLSQIHATLAFYYDHRDEVRGYMKADEEYARRAETEQQQVPQPSPGKDAHDDTLSC